MIAELEGSKGGEMVNRFLLLFALGFALIIVATFAMINLESIPLVVRIIGFVVVTLLAVLIPMAFGFSPNRKQRWLLQNGTPARAAVLQVLDTGVTINDNPMVKLVLRVMPEVGGEFEATADALVSRVAVPRAGDVVAVIYNPANPQELIVR